MLTGDSGTGKTHLLTTELAQVPSSVIPVIVYSPSKWKDFGPWLDAQVVTSLTKSRNERGSILPALADSLFAWAFGDKAEQIDAKITDEFGENSARNAANDLRAAVRPLMYGRLLDNLLGLVFQTRDQLFARLATTMATGLGLGASSASIDFCAALLLYRTPYSAEAFAWLTEKRVPDCLPRWEARTSEFSTVSLLATSLKSQNQGLLICFDQLEQIATPAVEGDTSALRQLIEESIQIVRTNANVAVVISALSDLADRALRVVAPPIADRVRADPKPQSLRNLELDKAVGFMRPRLESLGSEHSNVAEDVVRLLNWIASNNKVRRVAPRLLIEAANVCARQSLKGTEHTDKTFSRIWADIMESKSAQTAPVDAPSMAPPEPAEGVERKVEAAWQQVQSEGLGAEGLPTDDAPAIDLLSWSIRSLYRAVSTVSEVREVSADYPKSFITFNTVFLNGDIVQTRAYLANGINRRSLNSGNPLLGQLSHLEKMKYNKRRVILRTRDAFPKSATSPIVAELKKLRNLGFAVADIGQSEMITLAQLRRLYNLVPAAEFDAWLMKRVVPLPGLSILIAQAL